MKYSIITVDDSRNHIKEDIRRKCHSWNEVSLDSLDARKDKRSLQEIFKDENIPWNNGESDGFNRGEVGGWVSHYRSWKLASELNEPVVIFEDDALIPNDFTRQVEKLMKELPEGWDFLSLCIPVDQKPDYMWVNDYSDRGIPNITGKFDKEVDSHHYVGRGKLARAYHGYGHTAVLFSPSGGRKILDLVSKYGAYTPADCFILCLSHIDELRGYAPKPKHSHKFAEFNTEIPSTIKGT